MNPSLNFVVVYDHAAAGRRAYTAMELLADGLADGSPRRQSVWRVDLLDFTAWRDQALADASDADFIIVSSNRPDGLPSSIQQWLEDYRAVKHQAQAIIFSLLGAGDAWTIHIEDGANNHTARQPQSLLPAAGETAAVTASTR